jgi:hypothetical protein
VPAGFPDRPRLALSNAFMRVRNGFGHLLWALPIACLVAALAGGGDWLREVLAPTDDVRPYVLVVPPPITEWEIDSDHASALACEAAREQLYDDARELARELRSRSWWMVWRPSTATDRHLQRMVKDAEAARCLAR